MDYFTWVVSTGSWESFCFSIPSQTFNSRYFLFPPGCFSSSPLDGSFHHLLCHLHEKFAFSLIVIPIMLCILFSVSDFNNLIVMNPQEACAHLSPSLSFPGVEATALSQLWKFPKKLFSIPYSLLPVSPCNFYFVTLLWSVDFSQLILLKSFFFFVFKIGLFLLICFWIQGSTVLSCQVCHWVFLTDFFFNFSSCIF